MPHAEIDRAHRARAVLRAEFLGVGDEMAGDFTMIPMLFLATVTLAFALEVALWSGGGDAIGVSRSSGKPWATMIALVHPPGDPA